MGPVLTLILASVLTANAADLHAGDPPPDTNPPNRSIDKQAYCDWQQARSNAQRSALYLPRAIVSRSRSAFTTSIESPGVMSPQRDQSIWSTYGGLTYSLTNILKGQNVQDRSAQECSRYQAFVDLNRVALLGMNIGHFAAYQKQAAILQAGLEKLRELSAQLKKQLQDNLVSSDVYMDLEFKISEFEIALEKVRENLTTLKRQGAPIDWAFLDALRDYMNADNAVERLTYDMEALSAWDLSVSAGYRKHDTSGGWEGAVTLSYWLGKPLQDHFNDEAAEHYQTWSKTSPEKLTQQFAILIRQWLDMYSDEQQHTARLQRLATTIDQKIADLKQFPSLRAQRLLYSLYPQQLTVHSQLAYAQEYLHFLETTRTRLGSIAPM